MKKTNVAKLTGNFIFLLAIAFILCYGGKAKAAVSTFKTVETKQQFIDYAAQCFWNQDVTIKIKCKTSVVDSQTVMSVLSEAKLKKKSGSSITGDYCSENISLVSCSSLTYSSKTVEFTITVKYRENAVERDYVQKKAKSLAAKVNGKSDYAKAKYLSEWIVNNVRYEYGEYTAYSALKKGKGVCMAYAQLFQILATEAGLECHTIRGYVDDVYHMWNVVKINNKWYYLDATFMDTGKLGKVDYKYFLFGTDFCNSERTIETSRYTYWKLVSKQSFNK